MTKLILELDDLLIASIADAAEDKEQSIRDWVTGAMEARLESEEEEEE